MKYFFKKDVSQLYVASGEHLVALGNDARYSARLLSADEVLKLSTNPTYDISATAAQAVDEKNQFCCASFIDNTLTGYAFFAKGRVDAKYNSPGAGFGGVGLRLPTNALYVYKVFVLPEYRGKNQMSVVFTHGVSELLPTSGWVVTTTDSGNLPAQSLFNKLGFVQQSKLREYRLFGFGYYKMQRTYRLDGRGQLDSTTIELIAGALRC